MGSRVESIAFPYKGTNEQLIELVQSWITNEVLAKEIRPYAKFFVHRKNDLVLIDNFPVLELLEVPQKWEVALKDSNVELEWLLHLCYLSSGDSYGYCLYEHNKHIRTAYSYSDEQPVFIGKLSELENKYLSAPYHYEDDDEEKFPEIPEDADESEYYKIITLPDGKEVIYDYIVESLVHEISEQYLGINIMWDIFESDFKLEIDNPKYQ